MTDRMTGTVKWFSQREGYGLIGADEVAVDVFVHVNDVHKNGHKGLNEGDRVAFDIESTSTGQQAVNVTHLDD